MRNLLALLFLLCMTIFSANAVYAQDETATQDSAATEQVEEAAPSEEAAPAADPTGEVVMPQMTGYQLLKKYFIDGGWEFMTSILITLVLGLAFSIERIITLNIASTNTDKLLSRIDDRLKSGDMQGAMEVCKSTPGPTASILYEGLKNAGKGPDAVEKSIVAYGGVQMGLLERGLVWISLFIALAPMLGFLGTVIGMVQAFDRIEAVGDLSPTVVAGGIKVALLTTVFGLITAIILQIFYNYIVSKIDAIVNKMEDASIAMVDVMVDNNVFKQ